MSSEVVITLKGLGAAGITANIWPFPSMNAFVLGEAAWTVERAVAAGKSAMVNIWTEDESVVGRGGRTRRPQQIIRKFRLGLISRVVECFVFIFVKVSLVVIGKDNRFRG